MKRITVVLTCLLATFAVVQMIGAAQHEGVQKELLKNIHSLWTAFKDQNQEPFKQWLAEDAFSITATGMTNFSDLMKMIAEKQCKVTSFSIDDSSAHVVKLDANTYLITYSAQQDGTCSGEKMSSPVMVSEIWSNKDGKWKNRFYQETPQPK